MYKNCGCIYLNPPPPPPPPPPCTNCIWSDQPVVPCSLITLLCGQSYSIPLVPSVGDGVYTVLNYDVVNLANVFFTGTQLFFDVIAPSGTNNYVDVVFSMTSASNPGQSFMGRVRICIPNKCEMVLPPPGFGCNPCDGTLFVLPPEILVI